MLKWCLSCASTRSPSSGLCKLSIPSMILPSTWPSLELVSSTESWWLSPASRALNLSINSNWSSLTRRTLTWVWTESSASPSKEWGSSRASTILITTGKTRGVQPFRSQTMILMMRLNHKIKSWTFVARCHCASCPYLHNKFQGCPTPTSNRDGQKIEPQYSRARGHLASNTCKFKRPRTLSNLNKKGFSNCLLPTPTQELKIQPMPQMINVLTSTDTKSRPMRRTQSKFEQVSLGHDAFYLTSLIYLSSFLISMP